jgi:hypothetical protein
MKKVILTSLTIAAIAVGATAQNGTGLSFKFGYKSKHKKTNTSSLGFSGTLAKSYSLKSHTPYVKNQGNYGTCVSWAMAYSALTTQYAISMNLTNRNIITSMAFCPYFMHNNSKLVTDGCASGNFFDDAGTELTEIGVKKFYLPMIGCATPNDDKMLALAKNYRAVEVSDLYTYTDLVSTDYKAYMDVFMKKEPFKVDEVKKALSSNKVVVFGMYLPPSWFQAYHTTLWEPSAAEKQDPVATLLDAQGQMHALHAMSIIGYDDDKYGGAFEVMNSWGQEWGDNGYVWVKYADLQKYVFQMLVITMPEMKLNGTTGCVYGDCANGYGIYKHASGDMYEGFFKNSKYDGYGVYAWVNGTTYSGEWKDGTRNGDAMIYYTDGSSGPVVYAADEFKSGYQMYKWDDGSSYEGEIQNGEFNGFGKYKFSTGETYQGAFSGNSYEGLGKYTWSNGSWYVGFFSDGKRNGRGIYVSADGKVWGGNWSYDNFSTGKTYGFANGKGVDLGNLQLGANTNYVDANCVSGDCLNGKGVRQYNGSVYEGEFKDGVENGIGKTTYANGTVFETFYMAGSAYGVGVIKFSGGGTLVGPLKNGVVDGYIVYFDASGGILIGTYRNGEYVGELTAANNNTFNAVNMNSPINTGFKSLAFSTPGK